MGCITVNILKIRELFVHFKSYLLKFRRQYELLCCLRAKIRAFAKLECTLPPFLGRFRIENGRCWRCLQCHSFVRYLRISRLQRGVEPQYWRAFLYFTVFAVSYN